MNWGELLGTFLGQSGPEVLPVPDLDEKPDYTGIISGAVAIAALLIVFYLLTKTRA